MCYSSFKQFWDQLAYRFIINTSATSPKIVLSCIKIQYDFVHMSVLRKLSEDRPSSLSKRKCQNPMHKWEISGSVRTGISISKATTDQSNNKAGRQPIHPIPFRNGLSRGCFVRTYIRSITKIPSNDSPSFRVLAVRSHSTNRDVRKGSPAASTGHRS